MAIKITLDGKKNLEMKVEELRQRLQEVRTEKRIAYTATGDTWHDNPYFNKLEADEKAIQMQIQETIQLLREAIILTDGDRNVEEIDIGSIVKCHCRYFNGQNVPTFEEDLVLEIVGHGETDIDNGKIHYESPVAQSICGHHSGDVIPIKLPNGSTVEYTIVKFYANWDDAKKDS